MTGTITFRLDPELKHALAGLARDEERPMGEVLRDLVRERLERDRRRAFEAEARRQCLAANAAGGDAAEAFHELEGELDALAPEWT